MSTTPSAADRSVRRYTASHLNLTNELFDLVLTGTKTSTIRLGLVFVANEYLTLRAGGRTLTVRILAVDYSKTFGSLTEADAQQDGFGSITELKDTIKQFYPQITDQDRITILRFVKAGN